MPNVELEPPKRTSAFRRIALGTWRTTYDPQVYGTLTLRAERVLAFMDEFRRRTGKRLTLTHVVAKAVGLAFQRMPDANALLRLGQIYPRKVISVFLQVAMTDPVSGKPDLSGATIHHIDALSLEAVVEATEKTVALVRKDEDPSLAKSRKIFSRVPGWLIHWVLRASSFVLYTLNLDLSFAGIARDGFGSVMVTNVGSLGLDVAYAPLVPWSRVPMIVTVGRVSDEPVVEDGKVVAGKVLRLSATFDHRFIDGVHAAQLAETMSQIFADPERLLGGASAANT